MGAILRRSVPTPLPSLKVPAGPVPSVKIAWGTPNNIAGGKSSVRSAPRSHGQAADAGRMAARYSDSDPAVSRAPLPSPTGGWSISLSRRTSPTGRAARARSARRVAARRVGGIFDAWSSTSLRGSVVAGHSPTRSGQGMALRQALAGQMVIPQLEVSDLTDLWQRRLRRPEHQTPQADSGRGSQTFGASRRRSSGCSGGSTRHAGGWDQRHRRPAVDGKGTRGGGRARSAARPGVDWSGQSLTLGSPSRYPCPNRQGRLLPALLLAR